MSFSISSLFRFRELRRSWLNIPLYSMQHYTQVLTLKGIKFFEQFSELWNYIYFLFSFSNLYLIIFSDHPGDKGFKVWWYRRFYCIQHHTHSLTDVSDPGSIRKFVIILENLEDILQCRLCSLQTLKYLIFSSLVSEIPELVSSLCSLSNVIPLNIFTYLLLSRQHLSNVCMICLTERWKVDIPFQLQKFVQSNFLKKELWN